MQNSPIKFGTDGWRGVIAEDFTFDNVRRVAQATADHWNSLSLPKTAIVGYDNRFMSESYAKLVCEVLAANGITALYPPEAVPTPAVTYAVRNRQLAGAVMITASHNPPGFNGYKLKAEYAGPADPDYCKQLEARVDKSPVRSLNFDDAVKSANIELYDPRPAHIAAVKRIIDLKKIRRAGLRVVADSMHGCGGRLIEQLVGGQTIRAERDVYFGGTNPEPIARNLRPLCAAVKKTRAHIGVATDGDADRLGIVDERGRYVSIQLVFALLLLHLLRNRGERGGVVVKSTNCTVLIDRICRAHGLELVEVPVGFKHICQQMRTRDVLIGGEESGGIGFRGHIPERDGILANLMLLEMLAVTGKRLTQLVTELQKEFGSSAYDRIDMHYPLQKRDRLIETLRTQPPGRLPGSALARVDDSDGVKYIGRDDSWLMFRASGTEPIIRIYAEAGNAARVQKLLAFGRRLALRLAG
jgi:phosphomannomutase